MKKMLMINLVSIFFCTPSLTAMQEEFSEELLNKILLDISFELAQEEPTLDDIEKSLAANNVQGETIVKQPEVTAEYPAQPIKKKPVSTNSRKATPCYLCGKKFLTAKRLQGHLFQHAKKTIVCPKCNEPFDNAEILRMHQYFNICDNRFIK